MIRPAVVVWLVIAAGVAAGVYVVKYRAGELRADIERVRADIREHREALKVLRAEWSYLTRPDRLARLARERLNMRPVQPGQITRLDHVPPRVARGIEPARETAAVAGAAARLALPHHKPWSLDPGAARALASRKRGSP